MILRKNRLTVFAGILVVLFGALVLTVTGAIAFDKFPGPVTTQDEARTETVGDRLAECLVRNAAEFIELHNDRFTSKFGIFDTRTDAAIRGSIAATYAKTMCASSGYR